MARPKAIVSLAEEDVTVNALIYGATGVGKTVLLGTAPDALFLAVEKGTLSARRMGSTAEMWPINTWSDMVEAYKWLESDAGSTYQNVLVDSLTKLQEICQRDIVEAAYRANPQRRHYIIPAQDNYLEQQLLIKQMVSRLNELPVNVWYSCHEMRAESEDAETIVLPAIHGRNYAMSQQICAEMHVVGRLYAVADEKGGGIKRRLLCESYAPYFAKDRYGLLGRVVEEPTVPKLLARIGEEAQPVRRPLRRRAG